MSLPTRHDAFLQWCAGAGEVGETSERAPDEGLSVARSDARQAPWVTQPGRRVTKIRSGFRFGLKWAARGIYLSPLLLIPKIVLHLVGLDYPADLLVVVFVCIVLLFFALLNLYVLWAVVHWVVDRLYKTGWELPFTGRGNDALDLLDVPARTMEPVEGEPTVPEAGETIRVQGVIRKLGPTPPAEPMVIQDLWITDSDSPWRVTEATPFAVTEAGVIPVVINHETAPLVVATPRELPAAEGRSRFGGRSTKLLGGDWTATEGEEGHLVELAAGDRVELVGVVARVITNQQHFELEGDSCAVPDDDGASGSPYRAAPPGPAVLITGTAEAPVVLKLLSRATTTAPDSA